MQLGRAELITAGVGVLGIALGVGTTVFAAGRSTGADKQEVKALAERVSVVESSQKKLDADVVNGLREITKSMASIDSKLSGLEPLVRMAERHIQEDRVLKPSDIR